MRRLSFVALFAILFSTAAHGHVIVSPRESAPEALQVYTVRVPTEGTVTSTAVELEVPANLHVTNVASGEGFAFEVRRENNRIVAITWTREIKPKERAEFTFTAHNPASGVLQWKAHQHFADGSTRHWIGEPGTKEPASVTRITEAAPAKAAADPAHKH